MPGPTGSSLVTRVIPIRDRSGGSGVRSGCTSVPAARPSCALREERAVTVHLDSGTDVVIVEGLIATQLRPRQQ